MGLGLVILRGIKRARVRIPEKIGREAVLQSPASSDVARVVFPKRGY
jgi:hypothetical protein